MKQEEENDTRKPGSVRAILGVCLFPGAISEFLFLSFPYPEFLTSTKLLFYFFFLVYDFLASQGVEKSILVNFLKSQVVQPSPSAELILRAGI